MTKKKIENHDQPSLYRDHNRITSIIVICLSVAFCLFHLYTAGIEMMVAYQQRSIHLAFAMTLLFLWVAPTRKAVKNNAIFSMDIVFALISLIIGVYAYFSYHHLVFRVGNPNPYDIIFGVILIVLLLEATRRIAGNALTLISVVFLVYAYIGQSLPGLLSHRGYNIERIVNQMFLTNEGIYGVTLGVSATYVFLFIMFGTFLEVTGAGKFFLNLAISLFGKMTGGPAKAAVLGSALFGTVSGSAAANVSGTGQVTIPLMKRIGYDPKFAGAVESVASAGGQLVPPIMGAAAFIMVDILRLPYSTIIIAAILPSFLYYFSAMTIVHLQSKKLGFVGLPKSELPNLKETLKEGAHLILPLIILVVLLAVLFLPPATAIFWSFISLIITAQLRKSSRMSLGRIIEGFVMTAKSSLIIVIVTAVAGIVVGMIGLTGLGLNISSLLIALSNNNLIILLILTMVASIVLGMGLPTTAAYVILAVSVAPALINMGVEPLAAHLFVFYFGILSAITPPVAIGPYIAAGIAKTSPLGTAMWSMKIGLVAFVIPYMFVFNNGILMMGSPMEIIFAIISSVLGVFALSLVVEGYFLRNIRITGRVLLGIAGILLVTPNIWGDIIGGCVSTVIILYLWFENKNQKESVRNEDVPNEIEVLD